MTNRSAALVGFCFGILLSFFLIFVAPRFSHMHYALEQDEVHVKAFTLSRDEFGTFCSRDGVKWWKSRVDGTCYVEDEPK